MYHGLQNLMVSLVSQTDVSRYERILRVTGLFVFFKYLNMQEMKLHITFSTNRQFLVISPDKQKVTWK
jgi:hypothetical protein